MNYVYDRGWHASKSTYLIDSSIETVSLTSEIIADTVLDGKKLLMVVCTGSNVNISFMSDLTGSEKTLLDDIVQNHKDIVSAL